ncbi:hypothetical protein ACERJO_11720 [Halalkalibacter sp. AB-rgal2]|uniref:hypothetical protein n=1 Tax=Halalkalibacter sp. AB-rgal2 TaxID=3242695 RepID=UPI00359EE200
MKAKQFDTVRLLDGRDCVVLDIYSSPPGYEVEEVDENDGLTFSVSDAQIEKVL